MKEIYKKEMREVETTIYVACDGMEFISREECIKYEREWFNQNLLEKLEKIETCDALDDYMPFDGREHQENNTFRWYRPKNKEEIAILQEIYNPSSIFALSEDFINQWICIESEWADLPDPGESWVYTLDDCIEYMSRSLKRLGYLIEIKEND